MTALILAVAALLVIGVTAAFSFYLGREFGYGQRRAEVDADDFHAEQWDEYRAVTEL